MNSFPLLIFLGLMAGNVDYVLWTPFYRGVIRRELCLEKPEVSETPRGGRLKGGSVPRSKHPLVPFRGPHRGLRSNEPQAKSPSHQAG